MTHTLQQKVEAIVSDPRVREVMLTIFAESMAYIRDRKPEWCLVRFHGKHLRLFAGRLIVLTLEHEHVWTTTDPSIHTVDLSQLHSWCWDTMDTRPRTAQAEPYPSYKRPPSHNGYYTPSIDSGGDCRYIQESHFAYLDRVLAVGAAPDPRTIAHHEPDVADYIAKTLTQLGIFPSDRNVPSPHLRRIPSRESIDQDLDRKVKEARTLSSAERRKRLAKSSKHPEKVVVNTTMFLRNQYVIADVLARANGVCESCRAPAPFRRVSDGTPYLEVHHQVRLANGGEDTVSNAIALCPNCHRKAHYGN
jgi:5-methylcytosine-specific restriction endonuclease McrA